jgi:hypothetical protein
MKKQFVLALVAMLGMASAHATEFDVTCQPVDVVVGESGESVTSACSDGTGYGAVYDYGSDTAFWWSSHGSGTVIVPRENRPPTHLQGGGDDGLPAATAGIALNPADSEFTQPIWVPPLIGGAACVANHHATIRHLRSVCTGAGRSVRSLSAGICGMGASVRCSAQLQ